ncbi:MAG: hypothetical protein KatS3mg105_4408 [Gemmatales bacterium]|nr:MAG: hypothetical protein KatS3mg105_4408 [Gemmatales bacterium]
MTDFDPISVAREIGRLYRQQKPSRNGHAYHVPHEPSPVSDPEPVVATLASVHAEPVSWLWPGWIPRGTLTLMDGDPGLGKSTLTLDLAARVSRGWEMPPAAGPCVGAEPGGVLLLSAEDDLARVIRPRLDAAGADVSRIHALQAIAVGDERRPPILPADLVRIEPLIGDYGIELVIVDPFMAFLDATIDSHRDHDVRRCLHALKELAERSGVAILLIRHLNKLNHSTAMYRGGGSIGIIGAVRSGLIVGRDPHNEHVRVLASVKSNLGPVPRSLAYALEPCGDVARIGWIGETDLGPDDILARPEKPRTAFAEREAEEWLRSQLAAGPVSAAELVDKAEADGISKRTLDRAKKAIGVRSSKNSFTGEWHWELPNSTEDCHEDCQER